MKPPCNDYIFCGYHFAVPIGIEVLSVGYWEFGFVVHTDNGDIQLKACRKCKRMLSLNDFYQGKSPCKQCHILLVKSWRKRNPQAVKDTRRRYAKKRKELALL